MNLNFSPRHVRDKKMDQRLLSLLREHGVATSQVRIAVTGGALIDNADQVSEIIDRSFVSPLVRALLALGCTLGQGYLYSRSHRLVAGD